MSTQVYVLAAVLIGLALTLGWAKGSEQFRPGAAPPFRYPTDIPQPFGPQGWGYRNPGATYRTLLWDQTRKARLMPKWRTQQPVGYISHLVETAPVPQKCTPFPCARPPVPHVTQRQVAQSPYANWASELQP